MSPELRQTLSPTLDTKLNASLGFSTLDQGQSRQAHVLSQKVH